MSLGRFVRWPRLERGWFAWEIQVGPVVLQWLHERYGVDGALGGWLLVWRDPMWRA